ncbi:LysR family transcriptional regulator [Collinsella sp. AGMB00827]|uniref:LysR family transcriptional regulator n=1 Tax=Collinsella ureilytica TaxID=2869515 RepID=A0ABS7MK29_9ACTN|nr:LysR family transcriptional regulator [Collinsella urealyticum]
MEIRKLEAFLTIAATGTFTEAAEKLFISQSSLSKQMSQLEHELGVRLFKKTRNGVELTQAGYDFNSYAHRALPEYRNAVARLQLYREDNKYPLIVGALPLTDEYGISDCFSSYWVRNTSVQIEFIERSQENLIDKLRRHRVDLALIRLDLLDEEFDSTPLVTDELMFVCSVRNPLASLSKIDIRSLRNQQFIMLEQKSDITQLFQRACEAAGFFPSMPLHHSRHNMVIKAVQRGMGVSLLPRRLITTAHASDVVGIPLQDPLYSTLGFAWLADKPLNEVAQNFVSFIAEHLHNNTEKEA